MILFFSSLDFGAGYKAVIQNTGFKRLATERGQFSETKLIGWQRVLLRMSSTFENIQVSRQ